MIVALALTLTMLQPTSADLKQWGADTLAHIQADLLMPDGLLYGEKATPEKRPKEVSFNWGVGVMLQALNAGAKVDPQYKSRLEGFVDATRSYWNTAGPIAGYDVLPHAKDVDRYYDDNAWMVLGLAEASEVLGSKKVLGYAEQTFRYVMSGEDDQLGGGLYWHELKRESKNTCANAPAAAGGLILYQLTGHDVYLRDAERLYTWTREHLRDPDDGLYWDNINLTGKVQKTKWSYNSGLMLLDAAELFEATKNPKYADDAKELQTASLKHWVNADGALKDDGKFVHLLLDAWIQTYKLVPGADDPRPAILTGLAYLHDKGLDGLGHYGNRWDHAAGTENHSPFALIDQASAARAFFEASQL